MQASSDTRRRMAAIFGTVAVLLIGWAFAGWFTQRQSAPEPMPPAPASTLAERRLSRALHAALVALGKREDWEALIQAADLCIQEGKQPRIRLLRAEAYARAGRMAEASADYRAVLGNAGPLGEADWLAMEGRKADYVALCQRQLARVQPASASPLDANNTAWACTLLPGALPDYGPALALAEKAVQQASPGGKPTYLNTLGVVQFRAGRLAEAARTLEAAEKLQVEPFNWPFLAMAYQRTSDTAAARTWATRLRKHVAASFGRGDNNRHELLFFLQEMNRSVPR